MQTYAMITNIHTLYIIVPTVHYVHLGIAKPSHISYKSYHIISYPTHTYHTLFATKQNMKNWSHGIMTFIRSIRHYFSFFHFFQITHAMKSTSQWWTKWLQHLQPILLKSFVQHVQPTISTTHFVYFVENFGGSFCGKDRKDRKDLSNQQPIL